MKVATLLLALGLCTSVVGGQPLEAYRPSHKTVEAVCILHNDRTLLMQMGITFNGDAVDKILALSGLTYERSTDGSTNEEACNYDGDLLTDGGITIEADVFANGGESGTNVCGAKPIPRGATQNNLIGYEWYIMTRESFSRGTITSTDRIYHIRCFLDDAAKGYVQTFVGVYSAEDLEGDAVPVKPSSSLNVISSGNRIRLNDEVRLRVETKQEANRVPSHSYPYGSYVYHCDYRFYPIGQRRVFLDDDGCPRNGNIFGLDWGFTFYRYYDTQFGVRYFWTETPPFIMAKSLPPNDYYYLTCYVRYCTGDEDSDERCDDFCAYSRNLGRKKRSIDADADQVTLAIRIYSSNDTQSDTDNAVSDEPKDTTMIAIVATVGAIFFVLVVVGICVVCYAFRRHDKDDSSSTEGSTSNLPRHLKEAHLRPVKF